MPWRRHLLMPLLATLAACGCQGVSTSERGSPRAATTATTAHKHWDRPGHHGGRIVKIRPAKYHGEVVFENDGQVKFYTLGGDWKSLLEVDRQELAVTVRDIDAETTALVLRPDPQPGDVEGKTSRFSGRLPEALIGQTFDFTIESLAIGGERFRVGFHHEGHAPAMPAKVADEEERRLYLTPGGRYTQDDIKANGHQTVSQKFRAFRAAHDFKPRKGDPICPITQTKAHAQCTWVVGGKTYSFCCPPCIDEFVTRAKEKPESIEPPEAYIQR